MSIPMTDEPTIQMKNRRAFMRRRPKGKVRVSCFKGLLDLGNNLAVGVADISETGVMLLVKTSLDKGQDVTLILEGREHRRPIKIHGRVIWCVPIEKDVFRAGVRLDKYITYQEVMKIT